MPILWRRGTLMAIMAIAAAFTLAANEGEGPPHPFAPGEKLTYSVTWSVFQAGELTATLQRTATGPQDDFQLVTTVRSRGFVSLLYDLDDEYRSRFNPGTLCSEGISKRVLEGRRHKQTQIVFDSTRKLAILDEADLAKPGHPVKHDENPISSCTEDVVTAFYYLRNQTLHVGDRVLVPVNDGSQTREVTVEVQAREQIDTPLGRRYAFRMEPTVFGSLYKRKGRMLIWISDDDQRLPLRIKAMISVGTLTGTLQSVTEVPPVAASPAPGALPPAHGSDSPAGTGNPSPQP
ncbi:MAG TPA: DUF3108 domain-containing protein [Terriglobia bacterium]|nr:DUF3108 domain-containing protein [Terriglobia bacterium]